MTPGATPSLPRALQQLSADARLSGIDGQGEFTLLLAALPHVAEVASMLALHFGLTKRQSELAAHLAAGLTLLDAARTMGISRHTTNEHLVAVLRKVEVPDRKRLFAELQRAVQR